MRFGATIHYVHKIVWCLISDELGWIWFLRLSISSISQSNGNIFCRTSALEEFRCHWGNSEKEPNFSLVCELNIKFVSRQSYGKILSREYLLKKIHVMNMLFVCEWFQKKPAYRRQWISLRVGIVAAIPPKKTEASPPIFFFLFFG